MPKSSLGIYNNKKKLKGKTGIPNRLLLTILWSRFNIVFVLIGSLISSRVSGFSWSNIKRVLNELINRLFRESMGQTKILRAYIGNISWQRTHKTRNKRSRIFQNINIYNPLFQTEFYLFLILSSLLFAVGLLRKKSLLWKVLVCY